MFLVVVVAVVVAVVVVVLVVFCFVLFCFVYFQILRWMGKNIDCAPHFHVSDTCRVSRVSTLLDAPVATAARVAAIGRVSMSTRPDPERSGAVEMATRRWLSWWWWSGVWYCVLCLVVIVMVVVVVRAVMVVMIVAVVMQTPYYTKTIRQWPRTM